MRCINHCLIVKYYTLMRNLIIYYHLVINYSFN